jgi:hypothetical protein
MVEEKSYNLKELNATNLLLKIYDREILGLFSDMGRG